MSKTPSDPKTPPLDDDVTQLRDDATLLRNDLSHSTSQLSRSNSSQSNWRSNGIVTSEQGEAEAPKVLKQRFVLEERVGSGGMGSVYRAKDLRKVEARDSQPHIAIKVLNNNFRNHPEAFIALEREASKAQAFRHPNIVSIFDFDKDGDVPFITMELLEGEELADLLRTYPNGLPEELAWQVIEGMVRGLQHAHSQGVVHADFKPGNVYITQTQHTKILDFGIARAIQTTQSQADDGFDPSRLAALTPAYASREMLNGDNPEPRDDLFSLGVVSYMVLTGHHPYGRLPANDAAAEGLRAERIKSLSRRRWKMLEKCLQFNRQQRPEHADEVLDAWFGKPTWPGLTIATAAVVALVAVALISLQDAQVINEVKEEVRQETLVDAQLARIDQMLSNPKFDGTWQRLLFSELETLRVLAPRHPEHARVRDRIEILLLEYVSNSRSLAAGVARVQSLSKFGHFPQAWIKLGEKLGAELHGLTQRSITPAWIEEAIVALETADLHFADALNVNAARMELTQYVNEQVPILIGARHLELAQSAWAIVAEDVFELSAIETVESALTDATAIVAKKAASQARREAKSIAVAEVDKLLNVSCLRLDVGMLAAHTQAVKQLQPASWPSVRTRVGQRVADCVERLAKLNPDRALSLHKAAISKIGRLPQLKGKGVDPCSLNYLVGNGGQGGRGGFCADELPDTARGPRLVVVPGADAQQKFAISKYEISWREFNRFCATSGTCRVAKEVDLPVTGISLATVEAYAAWLSEQTGYTYRLPTPTEWEMAARGEPDPNRNCQVDIGGVKRGDGVLATTVGSANAMGLVHALGNVQELVKESDGYVVAVGGAFADPIESCLVSAHRTADPEGDERTGFRLVREVS